MAPPLRGIDGGRDDEASDKRRRSRLTSLIRRALTLANPRPDSLVIVAEGSSSPSAVLPLRQDTDADALALEVDETIADDAAMSRATAYRVVVQAGEETTATLVVRVRGEQRHSMDTHLRAPSESTEAAVVRQLMRHNEEQARLFLTSFEKLAALEEKRTARMAERLERLEQEHAANEEKSVQRMRLEMEMQREARTSERRAAIEEQAARALLPVLPRLAGSVVRALGPESESSPKGGGASASSPAAPPPKGEGTATDGARLLEVVTSLDPEAVDALAGWLEAVGRASDAADLRRIARKETTR